MLLATCNLNHPSLIERGPDQKAKANVHYFCSPVNSMIDMFHSSVDMYGLEPTQKFLKLCLALTLAAIQVLDTAHSAVLCQ